MNPSKFFAAILALCLAMLAAAATSGAQVAPIGPQPGQVSAAQLSGNEVTLQAEEVDIRALLKLLAQTRRMNIVAGPEITGNVSVNLFQVPFAEALDSILGIAGFIHYQKGNIVYVTTEAALSGFLSPGGVAQIGAKNIIVVRDAPEYLDGIAELIAALDAPPRQVLIAARILSIGYDSNIEVGMDLLASTLSFSNPLAAPAPASVILRATWPPSNPTETASFSPASPTTSKASWTHSRSLAMSRAS